jgi:hypothetical protein
MEKWENTLFGPSSSFYATGFWLYIIGIGVALAGGIIQLRR